MTDAPPPPLPPAPGADLPPPPPPPPPARPPLRVHRSLGDRRLGGVAGGLAVVAGVDSTVVRVALALGALTGWGLVAYIAAWIILKEEDPAAGHVNTPAPEGTQQALRIGLAAVAAFGGLQVVGALLGIFFSVLGGIGSLFFFSFDGGGFGTGPGEFSRFGGGALLGLLLIAGGSVALLRRHRGGNPTGPPGAPPSSPAAAAPAPEQGPGGPAAVPGRTGREWLLLAARAAGWLLALWFLLGALGIAAFWAAGALELHWPLLPALAALAALGGLVWALLRTRRLGVLAAAAAALLIPAVVTLVLARWDGQAGYRSVAPFSTVELEDLYRHGAGELHLDLSGLRLPPGRTPVAVEMGVGVASITVPWDATVIASAKVGAGRFELFGRDQAGFALKGSVRSEGVPGAPVLVLRTEAGFGAIEVDRAFAPETRRALDGRGLVYLQCRSDAQGNPSCSAPDAYPTPELVCLVAPDLNAVCRTPGEPFGDGEVSWQDQPGTRRCVVPAGGGPATCEAPVPGQPANDPGPADPRLPDQPGTYLCEIPPGGGVASCRPA